ncbi:cell division protein FtsQ [Oceaniovalibus guishaninsula JLT2003]|uniref:Cell division protein FtsQ n=1 Tax=Oceaniovalibus guishaninsula JLT2003 TaxID=1231392 RepID=K2HD28_9RHOB|nr:cell division protein FtsQ/DivIB [Oceaniovalibus guishaninsula]EKE45348.1 cell division protein FtsQ [Oceaniovalibus guishaninsula JLT2003]
MRSLTAPRRDPAPSRLSYRLQRLALTPMVRVAVRRGLPLLALLLVLAVLLGDADRRAVLTDRIADLRMQIQQRDEFMVHEIRIDGASDLVAAEIGRALALDLPVSSFDLDLEALYDGVARLDAVSRTDLRVRPGGVLEVRVVQRVPAAIWRGPTGLHLLDADGARVALLPRRADRPELPLLAGEGAERAVPEALRILDAARPIAGRIRGLTRMGERRWDVVLDNGQRILLPRADPVPALERVVALDAARDLLDRDVAAVDMRNPARPTLRLGAATALRLRNIKLTELGVD